MANFILKFGLYGLGISAILIGGGLAVFGSHAVVTAFNAFLNMFHNFEAITDLASANVESEFRFYGMMFVFYGGVLVQTASDLTRHNRRVPILLAVFFLAGVSRVLSILTIGTPHALFNILMFIELALPVVLFICWTLRNEVKA